MEGNTRYSRLICGVCSLEFHGKDLFFLIQSGYGFFCSTRLSYTIFSALLMGLVIESSKVKIVTDYRPTKWTWQYLGSLFLCLTRLSYKTFSPKYMEFVLCFAVNILIFCSKWICLILCLTRLSSKIFSA